MTGAIAWWGWVAIWGGLALALIALVALMGWWLFRKAMVVLDDLDGLGEIAAKLDGMDDTAPARARPAVLEPIAVVRAARAVRTARRDARRAQRRDLRMERAHRIAAVDVLARPWPDDWYPKSR